MRRGRRIRNLLPRAITLIAVVAALATLLASTPATAAPNALLLQDGGYSIGSRVLVADPEGLNVRSGPGLDAEVIAFLSYQSAAYVGDGPEAADGYTWYLLKELGQEIGWVAGEFLSLVRRDAPGGPFDMVVIAEPALNVRAEPGLNSQVIDVLPYGTIVTVDGGRQVADGYTWLELAAGGWVAGELLATDSSGDPAGYEPGTRVAVDTDGLNVRAEPGLGAEVVNVLPNGYQAFIGDGPVQADGYSWYQIYAMGETLGWVAGDYLTVVVGDGDGEPDGPRVTVATDWLNVRAEAGLDYEVVNVLPNGYVAFVSGGPVDADGYTWYRLDAMGVTLGWVAGEYLSGV